MSRRCWTCDQVKEDYVIALCKRSHCAALADLERENKRTGGTREPQRNPGEHPHFSITIEGDDGAMN